MALPTFNHRLRRAFVCGVLLCLSASSVLAGAIRVVTEELPPYSMSRDGQVVGMSTEVVRAVLKQVNVQATIEVMPWARAYDLALHDPNVLIYSIARTRDREKLFKWVGALASPRWFLYSLASHPVRLASFEEARGWQIATVNEDAGEQFLVGKRFAFGQQLQSSSRYELNYQKLRTGHVNLWISDELNADYIVRQAGDDPARTLFQSLRVPELEEEGGLSLAFSAATPDTTVQLFREGLRSLHDNGTYDAIAHKWK